MKTLFVKFMFLSGVVLVLQSCAGNQHPLHLHLQSQFNNDYVQVDIDGSQVYADSVTTNNVLGLADTYSLNEEEGPHVIHIAVNNIVNYTDSFQLNDELYIGINYDAWQQNIHLIYSAEPFLYE